MLLFGRGLKVWIERKMKNETRKKRMGVWM
jgi:hypothetical protein